MKQYLDLCNKIINDGEMIYNKRTGKNTLTIINADLEYNVGKGEFPLVTTRKSFYKSAIAEILGYIRGFDSAKDFRNLGTKTWDANANLNEVWLNNKFRKSEDDMGIAYRFRTIGYYEPTKTIVKEKPLNQKEPSNGDLTKFDKKLIEILKEEWVNMLTYNYNNSFVCDEWLVLENFINDFKKIKNWELKMIFPNQYKIDKEWVNSNYYSLETVRFSTLNEYKINKEQSIAILIKNRETGEKEYIKNPINFITKYNLPENLELEIKNKTEGDLFQYENFDIKIIDHKDLRYIEVDQLKLIYAKLKLGIDDRRLIMDAWYPHTEEKTCLMPCMHTHTFSLVNDTLHLTSYQRSCDVPLGLNFNMVQVYVLLAIMAQITGYKPGIAYHKIINAHIYEDQIDLMKNVQLKRKPYNLPTLKINQNIKSFKDIETWVSMKDFEVLNYQHHEPIKYPFAV
jgi:thymidylate synthase